MNTENQNQATPPIPDINIFLASSVHDMKNSISVLIDSLRNYVEKHAAENDNDLKQVAQMMYETQRINGNLIQLLTLYKLGKDSYPFSPETQNVEMFIDEVVSHIESLLNSKDITLEISMDDNLFWEFDADLVMGVIVHALNNAAHYCKDKILLEIHSENDYLIINVEDNGKGFPPTMIESSKNILQQYDANINKKSSNFISGSTGLGLYFSEIVAKMHSNNGRVGEIILANNGKLNGGVFSLKLP